MPTLAPIDLDSHALFAGFIADIAFFATADGHVHRAEGSVKTYAAHDGLTVARAIANSNALLTGGEDGRVMLIDAKGEGDEAFPKTRQWINAVAAAPDGTLAATAGKVVIFRTPKGTFREIAFERTIEDIAFFSKGLRLAACHYNGVALVFPATDGAATKLEWAGAHLGVTVSPDGAYVVTAMQENALHGWRLSDRKDLRMSGYPAKTKSFSWSAKGKYLATSGAPAAILWPFTGKEGPQGKAPLELGFSENAMVTQVCCHPGEEVVAVGFENGTIQLVRFEDGREVLLRRGDGKAVSAMGWDKAGIRLAFGTTQGTCGIIDIRA